MSPSTPTTRRAWAAPLRWAPLRRGGCSTAGARVYTGNYGHLNLPGEINKLFLGYKKKFAGDMTTSAIYHVFAMLAEGFARTGSTDPVKVAAVLEGMKFNSFNGE